VILYPAVDISNGRAVRLKQGRFDEETVYDQDPFNAARTWVEAGARWLHVVDLDGAREGRPVNLEHLERIATGLNVPVQYGGGLRDLVSVREALRAGATRVILGTAAYTDIDFLDEVMRAFADRLVVSVDVAGGTLASAGWTERTQMPADAVIERLQDRGVRRFIYTSIDRDGMLEGPDLDEVRHVASVVRGRFLYAGGIGALEHLESLASLRLLNLAGVVSGKALYEGRFTIGEAQALLDGTPVAD
jgi:phosphoribosylformimino-5-aminoimidazole carboxamide ribotide isomerase